MHTRYLAQLPTTDIAEIDKATAVVVQPIGAFEQHGPHLPVITDALIAERVTAAAADRLPAGANVWILPTLTYGKSTEHLGRAGTIALSTATLLGVCQDLGDSLARSGFRKLVFVNGHGGQPSLLDVAARDIRHATGLEVFPIMLSRFGLPEGLHAEDEAYGIHGGQIETSLVMALAPELVHPERARFDGQQLVELYESKKHLTLEGAVPTAWLIDDVSASGVVGAPEKASRELGELICQHWTSALAEALQEISDFSFPPNLTTAENPAVPGTLPHRNRWSFGPGGVDVRRPHAPERPVRVDAQPQPITMDFARTALLVVDMQNDFCTPGGWLASIGVDTSVLVPAANTLATLVPALRRAQVPVIWLNWGNRPDQANLPPGVAHVYDPEGKGVGIASALPNGSQVLTVGSWGAATVGALSVEPGDIHVDKYRMSGFWDTPLDSILRNLRVDTLLMTGVNTDQCVLATLIDAACLGYDVVLVTDACATTSPDYCRAATEYNTRQCFGFTATSADLLAATSEASPSNWSPA
jgi:creatinine amidohydrolase/Fe(II)-dependent formamide hydrolase-like protein/nicotinamidase-related amidase